MGKRITRKYRQRRGSNKKVRKKHRTRYGGTFTDGDRLMQMLHENSTTTPRPHSYSTIASQFNLVKEDDLYKSIMRKKYSIPRNEQVMLCQEAWRHQENPSSIRRLSECRYAQQNRCTRKNPVHRLADKNRAYHPATLVAVSMTDKTV